MGLPNELKAHLAKGLTTVARAWAITRKDGEIFGFTDHDEALFFDGITFRPETGLAALALEQSTGLSVDNTEAIGVLSDDAVTDADIDAGRFDMAEVRCWLVNWAAPEQRYLQFKGSFGEIRRYSGGYHVEIRGLSEQLNRPLGRVFQKPCLAVLGDQACRADLSVSGYSYDGVAEKIEDHQVFCFGALNGFDAGWFRHGRLEVVSGEGVGLAGLIKADRSIENGRIVTLTEPIRADVVPGDQLRLIAGCDKRFDTCRFKFNNVLNFQGFPDLPNEDWVMLYPENAPSQSGGSRR